MVNTPSNAVERFLQAWKDANWKGMADVSQGTWKTQKEDPVEVIQVLYSWITLHEFAVTGMRTVAEDDPSMAGVMADVSIYIRATFGYDPKVMAEVGYFLLRTVCEADAYIPSPHGIWGVNPSSIRRAEEGPQS